MADLKQVQLRIAWPPQISPCLWEDTSILVQFGFLGFILLHMLRTFILSQWKGGKKAITLENSPAGVKLKLGLSYKCSVVCSTLSLVAHLVLLSVPQNKAEAHLDPENVVDFQLLAVFGSCNYECSFIDYES